MNGDLFRATCKKYMELRHINTREKLREHTTCGSSTTFRKWWHDPELIPLGEFENMMKALKVPREEQFDIFK